MPYHSINYATFALKELFERKKFTYNRRICDCFRIITSLYEKTINQRAKPLQTNLRRTKRIKTVTVKPAPSSSKDLETVLLLQSI